jgi:hypothetical protein
VEAKTALNARDEGMRDYPTPGSELLTRMQRHVAQLAANGSSLRNQGAPGVVAAARLFLADLDLGRFIAGDETTFAAALDRATEDLQRTFPEGARNWGAARKVLNLFLRDCLYHTYLAGAYGLRRLRYWLEVPLDSQVAGRLRKGAEEGTVPPWCQIKRLTPAESTPYQAEASRRALIEKVARVDLDLWFWNPE